MICVTFARLTRVDLGFENKQHYFSSMQNDAFSVLQVIKNKF